MPAGSAGRSPRSEMFEYSGPDTGITAATPALWQSCVTIVRPVGSMREVGDPRK
jgi:hypothetical protein